MELAPHAQGQISTVSDIKYHVLIVLYSTDVKQQGTGSAGSLYHLTDRDVDTLHIREWSVRSEVKTPIITRTAI